MNQKGESSFICTMAIFALTTIVILCSLELKRNYSLLEKRTHLFLCLKETRGEFHQFMVFMGRTNWAIKNINRASLIMMFIPGLQGVAMDAQKAKKYLQYAQEIKVVSYLKILKDLRGKSCPLDPRMVITPFELGTRLLSRDSEGAAKLREKKWTYYFLSKPYLVNMDIEAQGLERVNPKMNYHFAEKGAKLSSLLSSR